MGTACSSGQAIHQSPLVDNNARLGRKRRYQRSPSRLKALHSSESGELFIANKAIAHASLQKGYA